jgi:hypothetical protein
VSDSVEGWCVVGNLEASRLLIRMDDWMDGQTDDGMDDRWIQGKLHFIPTSFTICNMTHIPNEEAIKAALT